MDQGHDGLSSDQNVDNDLLMDVCELSVCLGNLSHDVCKSTKILQQYTAPLGGDSESALLSEFRERFEQLSQEADAMESVLLEARHNRLMQLYKELKDLEPDENKRCQYLTLLYELFESDRPKLISSHKLKKKRSLKVMKTSRTQTDNMSRCVQTNSSYFVLNNECSRKLKTETITICSPRFDCIKESTGSITNEDHKGMEESTCEEAVAEINSPLEKNLQNSKQQICKEQTLGKSLKEFIDSKEDKIQETISNISANYINHLSDYTRLEDFENYIQNYELRKQKSMGKYVFKDDAPGVLSHRTPICFNTLNYNSSLNSNNSFLDEEYDIKRLSFSIQETENNIRRDMYSLMEKNQYVEYETANSEMIGARGKQFQPSESEFLAEDEPEPWDTLRLTVSNIKTDILKKIDHSLSVLGLQNQPEAVLCQENVKTIDVPMKNHPDNYEHGGVVESLEKIKRNSVEKVQWEHQHHIIIAPRVVIQLFKSNPAYKSAQAQNFYDQVNQLFAIIGQRSTTQKLPFEARLIQSRLIQVLNKIKGELPSNISYSEWVAEVGKYQLSQILSSEELRAYESLCRNIRDDEVTTSEYPTTEESRFRDALRGMTGQESQHLKASSVTGRLQIRSPHHQESVSESYLLLTLGLLGYLYRSLKDQLKKLEKRGETGAYLVRCLRKNLHAFREFLDLRKSQPCSLLCLYWQTREYQLLFQWLLEVLTKINQAQCQAIIVSLNEESCQRTGEQWRLLQMWLSEASKPLVSGLVSWFSLGQLTASDNDEFIIECSFTSNPDEFWQQRYRLTSQFSKLFDSQLAETIISVGKTVAYSKKYLSRSVETPLSSKELNRKLFRLLTHFYLHGDQEPLFHFLHKLHSDVSGQVLSEMQHMNPPPKVLLYQMHKYLMITDMHFYRELMQTLEGLLREPASAFNTKLFNIILRQMIPKQTGDIYVDRTASQGSKCWSCFLLRLKLPDYFTALLGEDIKEYEAIFPGLWKFHYANFVLSEIVARQLHFEKLTRAKHFDCIDQVDQLFDILFDLFLDAMHVLKDYLLKDLLKPAYSKLMQGYEEAYTLDDMLKANRAYLRTIRLGCFQAKGLRRCNRYLEQLYDGIMELDFQKQRFTKILENFTNYLTKYSGQSIESNEFLIPSYELTDQKRDFRWFCQSSIDALIIIRNKFHKAMLKFLYSLHLQDLESFGRLAQKLDRNGYYEGMDRRLQLVQRFEFKKKMQRRDL